MTDRKEITGVRVWLPSQATQRMALRAPPGGKASGGHQVLSDDPHAMHGDLE